MLDVQPGRSTFVGEVRHLREWVVQPDVDVALDPEWNVGRHGVPGQTEGRVKRREVNAVIRSLAKTVKAEGLPPKLLVVHQFRRGMVKGRSRLKRRDGVQTVLNFDGIGSPRAKTSAYETLSSPAAVQRLLALLRRDAALMAQAPFWPSRPNRTSCSINRRGRRRDPAREPDEVPLAPCRHRSSAEVDRALVLDSLRHRGDLEVPRRGDDRLDHSLIPRIIGEPTDELHVDLQLGHREALEIGEGAVAGAEVIQGDTAAELASAV